MLSIYAFSRENWQRASEEVELLFALLDAAIRDYTPDLVRQGVRVRLLGRIDGAARPHPGVHRGRPRADRRAAPG